MALQTIIIENGKHTHSRIPHKSGAFDGIKHFIINFQTKRLIKTYKKTNIVINSTIDVLC